MSCPAHTLASARHHHTAGAARRRSTAALARRSARCDFSREGRRGPQPPRYALYHNIRTLAEHNGKKCVLPCTPLAVAKILSALGMFEENAPVGRQLKGRTVVVVNRSEVVGRPLAAMCAPPGRPQPLQTARARPGPMKARDGGLLLLPPPLLPPRPCPCPVLLLPLPPPPPPAPPCPSLPARRPSPPA